MNLPSNRSGRAVLWNSTSGHQDYAAKQAAFCQHYEKLYSEYSDPFEGDHKLRTMIVVMYSLLIFVGSTGNGLVILTVLLKSEMRNLRNYFILMLAASDFIMCTVTVPFTMKFVLENFWTLGSTLCKVVTGFQAGNVFVSTFSITAISLDRYFLVTFPTNVRMQRYAVIGSFALVWAVSLGMAIPYFLTMDTYKWLDPRRADTLLKACGLDFSVCAEEEPTMPNLNVTNTQSPLHVGKVVYTLGCFLFQYLLPLSSLVFMNVHMSSRIQHQMEFRSLQRRSTEDSFKDSGGHRNRSPSTPAAHKHRKFRLLILAIVLTFAVVWLPWNIYNAILAFGLDKTLQKPEYFAFTHCVGMLSACVNPILYGLLNENFKRAYSAIFQRLCKQKYDSTITRYSTIGGRTDASAAASIWNKNALNHNNAPVIETKDCQNTPVKDNPACLEMNTHNHTIENNTVL